MRLHVKRSLPLIALCLPLTACVSSRSVRFSSSDVPLARVELENGTATWRLYSASGDSPTLERVEERTLEVARLGVRVANVDDTVAARLGVRAWEGIVLVRVDRDTAAFESGLSVDDVLVSLDGRQLSSTEQFTAVVERDLAPGRPAIAVVRRRNAGGVAEDLTIEITPDAREITDTQSALYTLESSELVRDLLGMQVGEVPPDVAQAALGLEAGTVLVAAVSPGSPAYLGGLRAGDRIVEFDGRAVDDLDDVRGPVIARARERGFAISAGELSGPAPTRDLDGELAVRVEGALGEHDTRIDVRSDLDAYSDIDIPILFECEETLATKDWSLLDFIFQFGANSRRQYLDAETREPETYSFFSMLPFGFYEHEKTPSVSTYRIFWFIEWNRG